MRARPAGAGIHLTVAYAAPETLAEVIDLLAQHQDAAKLLAGGQSLLVLLRQALVTPALLVELRAVSFSPAEGLCLGAVITQTQLERKEVARTYYTALAEAASVVATRQVRNLGTLGGNLCHADPTADPPAALIALGARLEIVGPRGVRQTPVEAFFRDFMEVDLAADEVLVRVRLPAPVPASGSAYEKYRLRQVDTALVGAAVWLQVDETGEAIRDARIGLAAAGPTPVRSLAAEDALRGARAPMSRLKPVTR